MEERNLLQRIRVLRVGERKLSREDGANNSKQMRKGTWREADEVGMCEVDLYTVIEWSDLG